MSIRNTFSKIDCLAFAAHPDDAELFCGGTLIKVKKQGYTTGIIDLTRGELSTNGDIETRQSESAQASRHLNLDYRENLSLADGNLADNKENRLSLIKVIRMLKPGLCLIPYWQDRHPDHRDASKLIDKAIFQAGLEKILTGDQAFRPQTTIYYMLHQPFDPSFIVDISDVFKKKLTAIQAYRSQFVAETGKATYINRANFIEEIKGKATYYGQQIGVAYGEAFYYRGIFKIDNIITFFS